MDIIAMRYAESLFDLAKDEKTIETVSYTNLDVYKRQE